MTGPLILVVDAGTSATKVAAVSVDGALAATAMRAYPTEHPRPGWVEQDTDIMFRAAMDAMRDVVSEIDRRNVVSIACSAQRATWIPLGANMQALGHYIGWQDVRGTRYADRIASSLGSPYTERTGMKLDAVAALSKIVWFLENGGATGLECFGGHQTMLLKQLGADTAYISPSEASYFGLLDVTTRDWACDVAETLGIDVTKLPRIVESGSVVGRLGHEVAARIGLSPGVPLVMGGGDLQLGALGVGAGKDGTVAIGIGTGGGAVAPSPVPVPDPEGRLNCLAHIAPGMWEVEGLGSAAGGTFRWFRDTLGELEIERARSTGRDVYDLLVDEAVAEGSVDGLVAIPSLAGLGSPFHDPDFSGVLLGLRLHHSRGQIIRAFMEGITFEQRSILDAVRGLVPGIKSARLWGGVSKSDPWCQLQVNTYDIPGARCRVADASLVGAAICGAVGVGVVDGFDQAAEGMVQITDAWTPEPAEVARSDRYYRTYLHAIDVLRGSLSNELHRLGTAGDPETTKSTHTQDE